MNLQQIGLRYERLLILSAPIIFACILVTFIAIASDAIHAEKDLMCYEKAAAIVDKNILSLEKEYEKREKIGKVEFANEYVSALSELLIFNESSSQCDFYKIGKQDTNKALSPTQLITNLRNNYKKLFEDSEKKPLNSFGIELPDKAKIGFFGTVITISAVSLAYVLQIILGPILLLWMGSLFNTRYRETVLIESASYISELFPHCINLYMCVKTPELKRRSIAGYYVKLAFPFIPTLFRIALLAIFIIPPTLLFCISLYYLGFDEYAVLKIIAGFIVSTFALVNLLLEMHPWHSGKVFPGPKFHNNK